VHSAHTPCRHSARAALHIHSHSCVCSPAAHARRAELGSIAQVRKKFPSISSVHNARVQDLRYALETCGEDAVGTKSDVAPRLIAVLIFTECGAELELGAKLELVIAVGFV
jgi:hypothetical protein